MATETACNLPWILVRSNQWFNQVRIALSQVRQALFRVITVTRAQTGTRHVPGTVLSIPYTLPFGLFRTTVGFRH